MRVKAAIFVAALVRRANGAGAFAVVAKKGAEEAGAVHVRVDRPDGRSDLYVPAPQSLYGEEAGERRFVPRFPEGPVEAKRVDDVILRERAIDPDLWVVAIEDAAGRHFLDDAVSGSRHPPKV
jgi:hypothetical protein